MGIQLTKPGVQDPNTGHITFYNGPAEAAMALAKSLSSQVQPGTATVPNTPFPEVSAPEQSAPVDQAAADLPPSGPSPSPAPAQPQADQSIVSDPAPLTNQPKLVHPSASQVYQDASGNPRAFGPGSTKMGSLITVLMAAARGGLAAAGSRSVGEGFQRGASFGPQQTILKNQAQQENLQTAGMQQAQEQANTTVSTPMGVMPMWKAKQVLAAQQASAELANKQQDTKLKAAQAGKAEQDKAPDLKVLHSNAVAKAMAEGRDPSQDPTVNMLADQITGLQKQPTEKVPSDLNAYSADWMAVRGLPNTPENRLKAHEAFTKETKVNPGILRIEALGETRGIPVTDTKLGTTSYMNWNDYNRASAAEPGRYVAPQYDPQTQTGIKAWRDLAPSGVVGKQVISYNTFLRHAGDLWDAVATLKNSGFPDLNQKLNWYRNHTGDPRVAAFVAKLDPVQKEFESFLLNNRALYDSDRADAKKIINENSSPEQMYGTLPSLAHTGMARLQETNAGFRRSTQEDIPDLITPEAQGVLQKFSVNQESVRPKGVVVKDPRGVEHTFPDQKSADAFRKAAKIQ